MSAAMAQRAWDSNRIDFWIPTVCTFSMMGTSTAPSPALVISPENVSRSAAPRRRRTISDESGAFGVTWFACANPGVT